MLLFPDLPFLKLVEPGRDEGVVRVETMVRVSGVLGSGSGYRVPVVVSTQPFADAHVLAQPASGEKGAHVLAQPASEEKGAHVLVQQVSGNERSCWLNRLRGARFRFGSPPLPPQFRGVRDGRSSAG